MNVFSAFGYYVLGPLIKLWVRGVELRAQAIAAATPDFEDYAVEDVNQAAREDTWAAEACALTADHFDLWEKELSKR